MMIFSPSLFTGYNNALEFNLNSNLNKVFFFFNIRFKNPFLNVNGSMSHFYSSNF